MSHRVYDLINKVCSDLDNNLVLNAGSLAGDEKKKIEGELETYQKYKLDVLFTLHNLYKIKEDFN